MTSFNKIELHKIEARLTEDRDYLLKAIRDQLTQANVNEVLSLPNHSQQVDDWALADTMAELDIAVVAHEIAELRDVQSALARIRAGTYGTCLACGADIPGARLQAYPSVQYCVTCQQASEFEASHATGITH